MRHRDHIDDVIPARERVEHKDIEFDDDFTPTETRQFRWDLIGDQLRQFPGRWARIPASGGLNNYTTAIKAGALKSLGPGRWDAATRLGILYVRYLGDE